MRFTAILFLIALGSLPCLAQDSQQFLACNKKAATQIEINACASAEADRVDNELNGVYRKLLAAANDDAQAVTKIKTAERAWVAYRDAYLEAMYPAEDKRAEYGSIYPMELDMLRAKLSRVQIAALQDLLAQYRE